MTKFVNEVFGPFYGRLIASVEQGDGISESDRSTMAPALETVVIDPTTEKSSMITDRRMASEPNVGDRRRRRRITSAFVPQRLCLRDCIPGPRIRAVKTSQRSIRIQLPARAPVISENSKG